MNTGVFSTFVFLQGVPFPQNEANAMDVVIQYAIHKLGFQLNDIVVYAWSIGGFTGTQRRQQFIINTFNSTIVNLSFPLRSSWPIK